MPKRVQTSGGDTCLSHSPDTDRRYQVGFVISPVGLAENQIVVLIVSREQAAVFILFGSKELQGDDSGLRKTPGARPVVLRALHSQTGSRLFQALTYR